MEDNSILFFYNPYKYLKSFDNVLYNVRIHYPTSDIDVYFDSFREDLQPYIEVAKNYKCNFNIRSNMLYYIHRNDPFKINQSKMLEWVERLRISCENSTAKWVLLLEDDVLIKRAICNFPDSDCGTNRKDIGFTGGGSIFKREKFLESLLKCNLENIIESVHNASWAGDVLLKSIFLLNSCSYEKWVELAEPNYFDDIDHAIYHGYKDLHELD